MAHHANVLLPLR